MRARRDTGAAAYAARGPRLADADPLERGRDGCRTAVEQPRRVGVGDVAEREAALELDEAARVAGQVEREGVGARLHLAREHVGGAAERRARRARPRARWPAARPGPACAAVAEPVAAREALGQRLDEERARGRDEREPREPAQQVVVLLVAELVRHHEPHLVAREVVDQVVVEHHPLGVAEPAHVGVHRAWCGGSRRPGRPRPRPRPPRSASSSTSRAERARRQRLELVEDRVDHDREEPDGDHAEAPRSPRPGRPPVAREAPDQRQRQRAAGGRRRPRRCPPPWPRRRPSRARTGSRGRRRARACAHPGARSAGRSPRAAARCRPRRPRRPGAAARRAARAAAAAGARRARASVPDADAQPREPQDRAAALRKSSARSSWKAVKYCFRVDRGGLDQAAARAEQEGRRRGGGHRHHDRQRQPRTPHPADTVEGPQMRIALLSDVHGNLPAFEAVLADIEDERRRGGLVPGRPGGLRRPARRLRGARPRALRPVAWPGNHDLVVTGEIPHRRLLLERRRRRALDAGDDRRGDARLPARASPPADPAREPACSTRARATRSGSTSSRPGRPTSAWT